jgi:hypothetical protein
MKRSVIVVGVMVVACSMLLQAQAPIPNMSPIIGVWKVNVDKSTYFPGPRPAAGGNAQTRQYVDRGNGVIAEVRINVIVLNRYRGMRWRDSFAGLSSRPRCCFS